MKPLRLPLPTGAKDKTKQGYRLRALTAELFPHLEPVAMHLTFFLKRKDMVRSWEYADKVREALVGTLYKTSDQVREGNTVFHEDPSDPRVMVWVDPLVITTSKPVKKRKVAK